MDRVAHSISLDLRDSIAKVFIPVKQNDTGRTLRISLTDGDEPYEIAEDCTAVLRGTKPDGHPIFNGGEIINNRILFEITPQMVAVLGEVLLEVSLFGGNGEQVTSASFGMAILEKTLSDDRVESSAEFTALQKIMSEAGVPEFKKRLQEMEVAINESKAATENAVQKTNDAIAEAERITSEAAAQAKNLSEAAASTANQAAEYAIKTADAAVTNASNVVNQAAEDAVAIANKAATDAYNVAGQAAEDAKKTAKTAADEAVDIANKAKESSDEATLNAKNMNDAVQAAVKECNDIVATVEQKLENGDFTPKPYKDFFTEEDQKKMVDQVLLKLPQDIKITSWKGIQEVVRSGRAAEAFSIGDQIECQHNVYGTLLWDVIGIDHDVPSDSQYTHSVTLQLHDTLPVQLYFDAPEPNNANSQMAKLGSNIWQDSAIRQWLNSAEDVDSWWVAQTDTDVAPTYSGIYNGFLKGMDPDFLEVVGYVLKTSVTNDTSTDGIITTDDRFFLPSITEIYGGKNYGPYGSIISGFDALSEGISEGAVYPYYSQYSDLDTPNRCTDYNRVKYMIGTTTDIGWLTRSVAHIVRSPNLYNIWGVQSSGGYPGSIYFHGANYLKGISPCCCIV